MKAIKEQNKVIAEIIEEFSHPDFLVCVQKSERFECVSLPHSDMTQLRVKATLGTLINNRLLEYSKKNGTEITINNRRRLAIIQTILQKVMTDNIVDEAFDKVSGWPKGIVEYGQQKFLVRKKIEPVDPRSGSWDELRKLFETGFGLNTDEHGEEQLHAFYSLVRAKLLQMRGGVSDRGSCPMLVLVGKENTGKTLIGFLLSLLLGQVENPIDPSAEINGWTDALLSSPVLFYDEASREDYSFSEGFSRGKNAENYKRLEYTTCATIATRGKSAKAVPAVWLTIRSLNPDSRAALLQTPSPNENGMSDKLILVNFHAATVPLAGKEDPDSKRKRMEILQRELPCWAQWLLNDFPKSRNKEWIMQGSGQEYRNQVPAFHHPEVMKLLGSSENDNSKKRVLLGYLKYYLNSQKPEFRSSDLYAEALADTNQDGADTAKTFCKIFKSAESVGRILSNIAKDPDDDTLTAEKKGNVSYYTAKK